MKRISSLFVFIFLICIIPMVSSQGLQLETNSYSLNKSLDSQEFINLTISNTEAFTFYNITIDSNNFISFPKISELQSGQSVNFLVEIVGNESFDESFTVYGYYYSDFGSSNDIYDIDVDYSSGLSMCDMTIPIGSKVIWHNMVNDDIEIVGPYNVWTNNVISENSTGELEFNQEEEFTYYFTRRGYPFGQSSCTINSFGSGYIKNNQYNDVFSVNVEILYPETILEFLIPDSEYEIEITETKEGIISLKNIGSNVAKNVHISAEWFSFNKNDFDIHPGDSVGVVYTVRPIVTSTNDTNKTHNKIMTISGNFNTYERNFSIYVPYATISDSGSVSGMSLIEWVEQQCEYYPDLDFCGGKTTVIIQNASDQDFNVTMNNKKVDGMFSTMFDLSDMVEEVEQKRMEQDYDLSVKLNGTDNKMGEILDKLESTEKNYKDLRDAAISIMIIVSTIIVCVGLFYWKEELSLKLKKLRFRYGKE